MPPPETAPIMHNVLPQLPYKRVPVLIIALMGVVLLMGFTTLHYMEDRLVGTTGEGLALAAADIADKLDLILFERYGDIKMMSKALSSRFDETGAVTEYLVEAKRIHPTYLWLGVTNAQGRIVAATDSTSVGQDRSGEPWFRTTRDRGGINVEDAQVFPADGGIQAVAFTAPIKGRRGEFRGVVTARVGLPALENVFDWTVRAMKVQRGVSAKIEYQFLTRDGDIIVDSVLHEEGKVNLRRLGLLSALFAGSAQPGYVEETHLRRHVPVVTGYAQTEGYGNFTGLHWGILVRMDRSDVLVPIRPILRNLGVAGAAVVAPLLVFLLWSSARMRSEWARTQASEAWLATTLRSIGDAVIATDIQGTVTLMNGAAERVTGWLEGDARGRPLPVVFRIVNQYTRQPVESPVSKVIREGVVVGLANHTVLIARDGIERPIDDSGAPIRDHTGKIIGVVLVFRDVTERARVERVLRQNEQDLLRALEEREVMARNLHDGIIQEIYAIGLGVEECQRLVGQHPNQAIGSLSNIIADLNGLIREVRAYISGLETEVVNGAGLEAALASLANTMQVTHALDFSFAVALTVARQLTPQEATHILYIAREAMSNTLQHARASSVIVSLQMESGCIRLEVADNGVGFDVNAVEERSQGLRNLAWRARKLGAKLTVISEPGRGTRIVLDIPGRDQRGYA